MNDAKTYQTIARPQVCGGDFYFAADGLVALVGFPAVGGFLFTMPYLGMVFFLSQFGRLRNRQRFGIGRISL